MKAQQLRKFTILLMRPDYVADTYGEDTVLLHRRATAPEEAIKGAQQDAATQDKAERPEDYYPVITAKDWIADITPEAYR